MTTTPQPSATDPAIPGRSVTVLLDQGLPTPLPTNRVQIRRITLAPHTAAGLHVHDTPVFGNIEAGSAVYQIEGGPAVLLTAGEVFYEPEGARVARFDAQEAGVTFLGYFLLDGEQEPGIELPER